MRRLVTVVTVAVLAAACGAGAGELAPNASPNASEGAAGDGLPAAAGSGGWVEEVRVEAAGLTDGALLAWCGDLTEAVVDESLFGDSPVYVGNEQPVEEVLEWAGQQPGYADIRVDREHNGWIVVSFTTGVEARRADLAELFPGVGVTAVEAARSSAELQLIHDRMSEQLEGAGVMELIGGSVSYADTVLGVVVFEVGYLTAGVWAAASEVLTDQPVCIGGGDPATRPDDSPQVTEGDGWRLLTEQDETGHPYRTGIATSAAQYAELWDAVGLTGERPFVDFEAEVVVWFGAVHGSSCNQLRLRGVVVDDTTVHAQIDEVSGSTVCTSDAIPHAFLVAVPRDRLPADGFTIQLDADGPPLGATDERTVVTVDLTGPGVEADPGDIKVGAPDQRQAYARNGDIIETGYATPFGLYVHCGATVLGDLNGVLWIVRDPADLGGGIDPVPPAWRDLEDEDQTIVVEVLIAEGDPPTLTATANGVSVVYVPGQDPNGGCD